MQLPADTARGLELGERVSVGIRASRLLVLVLLTYTLPLIGLLSGALIASTVLPGGDGLAVTGGLIGGALAALPALYVRRRALSATWLEPDLRRAR